MTLVVRFQPWLAIWVTYLTEDRHVSLAHVGMLESFFWAVAVVTEIPTGAFADRVGRKTTFVVALAFEGVAISMFGFANDYVFFILANAAWATGLALWNGNVSAFVYDSLAAEGQEDRFTRRFARVDAATQFTGLAGGIAGGLIAQTISLQAPFILQAPLALAGLVIAFGMQEPPRVSVREQRSYGETVRGAIRVITQRAEIRRLIVLRAGMAISSVAFLVLMQPFVRAHDVPIAAWGLLFAPIGLAAIAGAISSDRLAARFGLVPVLAVGAVGRGGALLVLGLVNSVLLFPAFYVAAALDSLTGPLVNDYINQRSDEHVRATVLSFDALGFSLVMALGAPAAGLIADGSSSGTALAVLGFASLAVAIPAFGAWALAHRRGERSACREHESPPVACEPAAA
jgi:MFS family permease